jgi:hypothetical protein
VDERGVDVVDALAETGERFGHISPHV